MPLSLTIFGYGWLAQHFASQFHSTFNPIITTSKQSNPNQFSSKHSPLDIYHLPDSLEFPATDCCLITFPFSRQLIDPNAYYVAITKLFKRINLSQFKTVIFTSSTSVYPLNNNIVDETSPIDTNDRSKALYDVESFIFEQSSSCYILRLSGICGYSRLSQSKLNQSIVDHSNLPVNLIHVDDVSSIIHQLFLRSHQDKDFINVTCTEHPSKKEYYRHLCNKFKLKLPQFKSSSKKHKKVSNYKLTHQYHISLIFDSPLDF